MKIRSSQKVEIVKKVLEKNRTYESVGKEYSISVGQVLRYVNIYKIHGKSGLIEKVIMKYGEEKVNVVKSMIRNNWSFNYTSIYFNISITSVIKWYQIYIEQGEIGLFNIKKGRPQKDMKKEASNKLELDELTQKKIDSLTEEEAKKLLAIKHIQLEYAKDLLDREDVKKKTILKKLKQ